jgi:hypothetical protein
MRGIPSDEKQAARNIVGFKVSPQVEGLVGIYANTHRTNPASTGNREESGLAEGRLLVPTLRN